MFFTWVFLTRSLKLKSGFQSVKEELILHGNFFGNGEGLVHLQQMLSTFTKTMDEELSSALKEYKSYKESFVKHLRFDPAQPNLSGLFSTKATFINVFLSFQLPQ